jgi:hypothetical protein
MLEHEAEVDAPDADGGVVRAEGGLAALKGAFVLGACAGRIPKIAEHEAKVVAPGADVGVVGAKGWTFSKATFECSVRLGLEVELRTP